MKLKFDKIISKNEFESDLLNSVSPSAIRNFYKRHVNELIEKGVTEDNACNIVLDNIAYVSKGKGHDFYKKLISVIPEIEPFLQSNGNYNLSHY